MLPVDRYYASKGIVRGLSGLVTFTPGNDSTDVSLGFSDHRQPLELEFIGGQQLFEFIRIQ